MPREPELKVERSTDVQDPVIFSGTVRSNLDPFGRVPSDFAIWEALRQASLHDFVRTMPVSSSQCCALSWTQAVVIVW